MMKKNKKLKILKFAHHLLINLKNANLICSFLFKKLHSKF